MHTPSSSSILSSLPSLLLFLLSSSARTALADCETHSFTTCPGDGIVHWYDPRNGQICDPLDCGGGRAPVKYDVPGCAAYTGTETRATSASFLPCWTPSSAVAEVTSTSVSTAAAGDVQSSSTAAGGAQETSSDVVHTVTPTTGNDKTATTTVRATLSPTTTGPPPSGSDNNSGSDAASTTTTGTAVASTTTGAPDNAGVSRQGSLIAVVGAVLGAVALV